MAGLEVAAVRDRGGATGRVTLEPDGIVASAYADLPAGATIADLQQRLGDPLRARRAPTDSCARASGCVRARTRASNRILMLWRRILLQGRFSESAIRQYMY